MRDKIAHLQTYTTFADTIHIHFCAHLSAGDMRCHNMVSK